MPHVDDCRLSALRQALSNLRAASGLISALIASEYAARNDRGTLERLHCAKGGVDFAIEEILERLPADAS